MDCRYCDEPMERQDDYLTNQVGKIINKGAMYVCHTCQREWRWELWVPGLLPLFHEEDIVLAFVFDEALLRQQVYRISEDSA